MAVDRGGGGRASNQAPGSGLQGGALAGLGSGLRLLQGARPDTCSAVGAVPGAGIQVCCSGTHSAATM